MKKLVSFVLVVVLAFTAVALISCSDGKQPAEKLKLGLGIVTTTTGSNATGEKNGSAEADVNMAAVLVDAKGVIKAVKIDVAQNKVAFTLTGEAISNASFQTKKELKEAYGMSKTGKVEWYLQVEKLENLLVGKTLEQVSALSEETIQTAGCTIGYADLLAAVSKAVNNAKESDATASDTLALSCVTSQSVSNATLEKAGKNEVDSTIAAVVTNADKKVVAAVTDVIQVSFSFDYQGNFTFDTSKELKTKTELKENYGMSKTGKVEWYLQNEAFDAQILNKTADEISNILTNADAKAAVQTAGCTIGIDDHVAAVVKAAQ